MLFEVAMKKVMWLFLILLIAGTFLAATAPAEDFPAVAPQLKPEVSPPPVQPHPQRFYGYVPPPPIRHVWPGGYRVLFHQMTNTLIEHLLGRY